MEIQRLSDAAERVLLHCGRGGQFYGDDWRFDNLSICAARQLDAERAAREKAEEENAALQAELKRLKSPASEHSDSWWCPLCQDFVVAPSLQKTRWPRWNAHDDEIIADLVAACKAIKDYADTTHGFEADHSLWFKQVVEIARAALAKAKA